MTIWLGDEAEGSVTESRIFVKGFERKKILENLHKVSAVYFGHAPYDWETIALINSQTKVYVELDMFDIAIVPMQLLGNINIILRMPNYIRQAKIINEDKITVADFNKLTVVTNNWNGHITYEQDSCL